MTSDQIKSICFLQKHNLVKVFLMHGSCKTIFREHNRWDKYKLFLVFFNQTTPTETGSVPLTVRFAWLNFSSKITLYQTYFPNRFKISASIISAISSFIFTHIQPTLKKQKTKNLLSLSTTKSPIADTFWHLVMYIFFEYIFLAFIVCCQNVTCPDVRRTAR